MTMTISGSSGLIFPDGSGQETGIGRNRIINGSMVVDQRNAGASVALSSTSVYPVDRFIARTVTGTGNTGQQVSTAPAGFSNSLKITIGTGASPGVSASNYILQSIEGFNVSDLAWGTASAKTVTLSFQVYSSLTGTFGGAFQNNAGNRSYPFTYTISSANTWTTISVTVAGDTTGTWLTNNSAGITVIFDLGSGSNFQGSANTWAATDYRAASGCTQVVGTSGATFYITGVQLEVGSTATPFERRMYTNELQLCQRYYQKIKPTSGSETIEAWTMWAVVANSVALWYPFPTTMRAAPTGSSTGTINTDFQVYSAGSYRTLTGGPNLSPTTPYGARIDFNSSGAFTSGYSAGLYFQTTTASISFSAEL